MKILVAMEFSGVVRDPFLKLGYDAISCDLLPTEKPGPHYQGDVRDIINNRFDLMICHPSCQYLCSSGLHWNKRVKGRQEKTEEALEFVQFLLDAPIKHIALENPIGCISPRIRKPNFICQPWQFGHPESKATCFWTKNLPDLIPTNILPKPKSGRWDNQTPSGQNKLGPSKNRWMERSRTYLGIAEALATQYGKYITENQNQ